MKPNVIKYAQGAGEGAYWEVIHTTPAKMEKIKKLLNDGSVKGYEVNIQAN